MLKNNSTLIMCIFSLFQLFLFFIYHYFYIIIIFLKSYHVKRFKTIPFNFIPQPNLYPTIGLQTPGEIVDVNFGQQDFLFDIDEMKKVFISETI